MPRVRPAAATAVLALAVALLSACTDDPATPAGGGPSASVPASAAAPSGPAVGTDMLEKAVVKSLAGPLRVHTVLSVSGRSLTLDADTDRTRPTNALALKVAGAQTMEVRVLGGNLFLKQAGLGKKPWVRVDLHRLPLTSSLLGLIDVRSNLAPVTGVTSVKQTGPGTFEGILNLEQASLKAPNAAVRSEVNKLITEAATPTAVPFKASVDGEGRLVQFDYDIVTRAGAGLVLARITLSRFGSKINIAAPPSGQTESAGDEIYKRL